jgi:hypothetical protein
MIMLFISELHQAMSMRLVSSGSYNVRASEMAHYPQDRQPKVIPCIVHFLDDSHETFEVDVSINGRYISFNDQSKFSITDKTKSVIKYL